MGDDVLVLLVPSEPDVSALRTVEEATIRGDDPNLQNFDGVVVPSAEGSCCQVEILIRPNEQKILLYSRDFNGRRKCTGGDEFYIRYEEHDVVEVDAQESKEQPPDPRVRAVALITDMGNGSYELEFSTTPMFPVLSNEYDILQCERVVATWTVFLEYTNGIGAIPPPLKNEWPNGGYTHTMYQISGDPSLIRPPIREFRRPTPAVDLSMFDQVFVFGDSTFCQFVRQRPNNKGKYYFQPNLHVLGEKVRVGLNSRSVSMLLELLEENDADGMSVVNNKKRALMVGSCLWDILDAEDDLQGSSYDDHARACVDFVLMLQKKYPDVVVVWKSPMACHIHWVDLERVVEHDRATATLFGLNRIRYMSASRSRYLYKLQKNIMRRLGIPFLDLFEATYLSADQLYPSDGRHYRPDLNRKMLAWFYPQHQGECCDELRAQTPKYYPQVS